MPTVKIALLLCGNLSGKAYARNGGYYDIYHRFLHESLPKDSRFVLDPYDVARTMEYPSENDIYDCIMLTGSAASAYENLEWVNKLVAYVARVAESKPETKIIGICFGHQIIARALGGECVPNGGRWECGPTPIQLTELGKQLFGATEALSIQQMHRDHVPSVPPNFHLLASTKLSPNQGMVRFMPGHSYVPPERTPAQALSTETKPTTTTATTTGDTTSTDTSTSTTQTSDATLAISTTTNTFPPAAAPSSTSLPPIHILTVQGHPEFTEPIVSDIIEQRSASDVIDVEAAADAERRRFWKADGVAVFGKTIWEVMLQGKETEEVKAVKAEVETKA